MDSDHLDIRKLSYRHSPYAEQERRMAIYLAGMSFPVETRLIAERWMTDGHFNLNADGVLYATDEVGREIVEALREMR
jgi:hypothetical protein